MKSAYLISVTLQEVPLGFEIKVSYVYGDLDKKGK